MGWPLALALALSLANPPTADGRQIANPHVRVRPMQKHVEALLGLGMARSATFRHLVGRIEASDVIVYIETRHNMRHGVGATMKFMSASASDRFLRIQLDAAQSPNILVALLGHELQHVVEVADHIEVKSAEALRAFYRRTGVRTGPDSYDSIAAREAGYQVRGEILDKPGSDLRMARGASRDEMRLMEGSSIVGSVADAPGSSQ